MRLAISEAKARLTDLVRKAEAGEDVVLTRHGREVARLVAIRARPSAKSRGEVIASASEHASAKIIAGVTAANSQDFLYDDEGLPK